MKYIKWPAVFTALGVALVICVAIYYYVITPSTAVLVAVNDFPSALSLPFSTDALIDRVVAHLDDMISTADSGVVTELGLHEGLEPRPIPQKLLPIRALSSIKSPVFSQKWSKGLTLNSARQFGMSLKSRQSLEIEVVGEAESKGGWRLTAFLKKRPDWSAHEAGNAPHNGGPCSDLQSCAKDLAEQILRVLDPKRLLNFNIKLNTQNANQQILDIYQNDIPSNSLATDDLVAWGNAFYGLRRYDDALRKYQQALENDANYCPARIARGVLYSSRPHEDQILTDLQQANQDFRAGIVCDPNNAFAHNNLCAGLLREWVNSGADHDLSSKLLIEAQRHCDRALEIDPHLVIAAVNKANLLYRKGHHDESLNYFDELSKEYSTDSSLFVIYGFLLYKEYLAGNKDSLSRAINKTRKSWQLNQNNYAAINNLGYFYYEKGDYDAALDFWKKANLLNGNDPDCLAGLALAFYKAGQPQEAFIWLKKAISADVHYSNPEYLKRNVNWSDKAATDLASIIGNLPT